MMALLFVLHVGTVEPELHTPVAIPYQDCLEMAGRVALWYDKRMAWNHPEVYCEIQR